MAKGIFLHRADSIYDDLLEERYQFPSRYLKSARQMIDDWIIYLEPTKSGKSGYHAVAKIQNIISDSDKPNMYQAIIEPGTFLPFEVNVPFYDSMLGHAEKSVLNEASKVSGRAQAAIRVIPVEDFNHIVARGIPENDCLLPRQGTYENPTSSWVAEDKAVFAFEQHRERTSFLSNRLVRDRVFRSKVLNAYDGTCAFTGLKFVNGGGRAEAEAAHIRPVEENGPDIVSNGIALSGTLHWMFDRGLLSMTDDLEILVSRQVNDQDGIRSLLNRSGYARLPNTASARPHPRFLDWHRTCRFKA